MKSEIVIPVRPISKPLQELIDEHNARVEKTWLTVGSRCKPFNAKRAADGAAAQVGTIQPQGEAEFSFGLRSGASSPTSLTNDCR